MPHFGEIKFFLQTAPLNNQEKKKNISFDFYHLVLRFSLLVLKTHNQKVVLWKKTDLFIQTRIFITVKCRITRPEVSEADPKKTKR